MSGLARQHEAINLSQGFPNFPISQELIESVSRYMRQGYNQYSPAKGLPALREILADKIMRLYGRKVNPNQEITITAGATQAIFSAIVALVRQEEEVIIFEPAYDSYVPSIQVCGGVPIGVQLKGPDYKIRWEEVKSRISSKTRMIILNTPHNPCGTIIDEKDMEELKAITKGTDILVLSDEVYEHIVLDEKKHLSLLGSDLFERCVCTYSFGKVLHNTGWKTGYVVAPDYLMKEIYKVHEYNVFSVNTPVQHALTDFYQNESNYLEVAPFYQKKRDYFLSLMKESRFTFTPTQGTYFQLMNYQNISEESDVEFARRLTIEHGVASIPISVFYAQPNDEKMLRFCFAKTDETLQKAAEKLCKI